MSTIQIRLTLCVLCLAVAACAPEPPRDLAQPEGVKEPPAVDAPSSAARKLDIGDAEAAIKLEALPAAESRTPGVQVEELRNARDWLDLVTVTAPPPPPKEFWLTVGVKSSVAFKNNLVVVRAKIMRDKDVVDSFATVFGADAIDAPFERRVDVFKGLEQVPDTVLVHAQAELILLPEGTDRASVDIATVTGTAETVGTSLSNPVRITFGATEEGS